MKHLVKLLAVAAILMATLIPAKSQSTPIGYKTTNMVQAVQTITAAGVAGSTNAVSWLGGTNTRRFELQGQPVGLMLHLSGGAASNSVVNIDLGLSVNGTNFSGRHTGAGNPTSVAIGIIPMTIQLTNGSTYFYTNIPASLLNGARYMKLSAGLSTNTYALYLSNATAGYFAYPSR